MNMLLMEDIKRTSEVIYYKQYEQYGGEAKTDPGVNIWANEYDFWNDATSLNFEENPTFTDVIFS